MADLRRLGKRGSYRLGRLGGPRPAPSAPPAPHYPSFAPQHRGPAGLWLLACLAGVVIVAAGALAGWWFLPFLAGLAGGLVAHYGRWRPDTGGDSASAMITSDSLWMGQGACP